MQILSMSFVSLAVALVLSIPSVSLAQFEASSARSRPYSGITVSGMGEVRATPDIAYVTLGVRTRAKDAQGAASDNSAVMARIMQAVRDAGIAQADIQTVQYSVQPVYEYPQNESPRLVGYEATNMVRVTVRDLLKTGRVIDVGVAAGANSVQDVAFSIKDDSGIKAKALTEAIADAKAKAEVMASALGVKLGIVVTASEASAPIITPVFSRVMAAAPAETPISPGQIEVRASVNLFYTIVR